MKKIALILTVWIISLLASAYIGPKFISQTAHHVYIEPGKPVEIIVKDKKGIG